MRVLYEKSIYSVELVQIGRGGSFLEFYDSENHLIVRKFYATQQYCLKAFRSILETGYLDLN